MEEILRRRQAATQRRAAPALPSASAATGKSLADQLLEHMLQCEQRLQEIAVGYTTSPNWDTLHYHTLRQDSEFVQLAQGAFLQLDEHSSQHVGLHRADGTSADESLVGGVFLPISLLVLAIFVRLGAPPRFARS